MTKKVNNPLTDLLATPTANLLNIYCTAGFPHRDDTSRIIHALQSAGADMIEIGIPFSDPLADGPTIQKSSMTALNNGMTVHLLFEQLEARDFKVPIILMGYFNPILQFGIEKFCERCAAIGVSGLIIPDLPLEYYVSRYKSIFENFDLSNICLVTPQTSESRIRYIDEHCTGFIYAVSSSSTTGSTSTMDGIDSYLQKLKAMKLQNPILTGFNIHDQDTFRRASKYTRGAIIGSAFIREISNSENIEETTRSFIKKIRP
jgi:tryptophan synthase alpha chain